MIAYSVPYTAMPQFSSRTTDSPALASRFWAFDRVCIKTENGHGPRLFVFSFLRRNNHCCPSSRLAPTPRQSHALKSLGTG
ncbi:HAT family dimerization domain protein [Fusarium oxysporum f. sp. albedinis]|nr:HAT family dimerization domain protein [Fusarium oxysporum f. sp. albedinis]